MCDNNVLVYLLLTHFSPNLLRAGGIYEYVFSVWLYMVL